MLRRTQGDRGRQEMPGRNVQPREPSSSSILVLIHDFLPDDGARHQMGVGPLEPPLSSRGLEDKTFESIMPVERTSLALVAGLGLLECASAFSPSIGACPIARSSAFATSIAPARAFHAASSLNVRRPTSGRAVIGLRSAYTTSEKGSFPSEVFIFSSASAHGFTLPQHSTYGSGVIFTPPSRAASWSPFLDL